MLCISYLRIHFPVQGHEDLLLCFLLRVFFFFLYMTWTGCSASFFCLWISSCPSTVSYNGYYFYQFILIFLSKIKMTINVKVYIWIFSSIPFISMSVLMQVSHYLDHCSFVVSFEIRKFVSSNFFCCLFSRWFMLKCEMWNVEMLKCENIQHEFQD